MVDAEWHGTDKERDELISVLDRNCACEYDEGGLRTSTCPPHKALFDQRFLNGVLAMRHYSRQLKEQEGITEC